LGISLSTMRILTDFNHPKYGEIDTIQDHPVIKRNGKSSTYRWFPQLSKPPWLVGFASKPPLIGDSVAYNPPFCTALLVFFVQW
jgi:hypothetical protein